MCSAKCVKTPLPFFVSTVGSPTLRGQTCGAGNGRSSERVIIPLHTGKPTLFTTRTILEI